MDVGCGVTVADAIGVSSNRLVVDVDKTTAVGTAASKIGLVIAVVAVPTVARTDGVTRATAVGSTTVVDLGVRPNKAPPPAVMTSRMTTPRTPNSQLEIRPALACKTCGGLSGVDPICIAGDWLPDIARRNSRAV